VTDPPGGSPAEHGSLAASLSPGPSTLSENTTMWLWDVNATVVVRDNTAH